MSDLLVQNSDPTANLPVGSDKITTPEISPERSGESPMRKLFNFFGELLHIVIISLAIILPIRYFLIQPFYVKGASMEPNFYDHEYLIIDEISYRFSLPERGDIVVFRYPEDPRQFFIKRVIGLPGERIVVLDGKVIIYNQDNPQGIILDEKDYLGDLSTAGAKDVNLANDEYFLMGDNRPASMDSRIFGAVPRNFLIGRVAFRGWPPERMKLFFNDETYNHSTSR